MSTSSTTQRVDLSKMDPNAPLTVGLFLQAFSQLWDDVLFPMLKREFATKEDLKMEIAKCVTKEELREGLRELRNEFREDLQQTERRICLSIHQKIGTFIEEQYVFNADIKREVHQLRGAVLLDRKKLKYRV